MCIIARGFFVHQEKIDGIIALFRDISGKKGWNNQRFLKLQVVSQVVSFRLRDYNGILQDRAYSNHCK